MNCLCASSLERALTEYLREQSASLQRPVVLGVAGHPYTGKSHLARAVQEEWSLGHAAILPTESAVLPRSVRLQRGFDGCSPAAHEMQLLLQHINALRAGQTVRCREYCWLIGDAIGTTHINGLGKGDLLVIDGSVAAVTLIAELCDLLIQLSPTKESKWLDLVCERDTKERGWNAQEVYSHNTRKAETSRRLQAHQSPTPSISVQVDPVTWRRLIIDCSMCPRVPSLRGLQPYLVAVGQSVRI